MASGYQKLVGVGLGLVVLLAAFFGAYTVLTDNDGVNGGLTAGDAGSGETAAVTVPTAGDVQTLSSTGDQNPISRGALRVVTDTTPDGSADMMSESSTTTADATTSSAAESSTTTAKATTTTAKATTSTEATTTAKETVVSSTTTAPTTESTTTKPSSTVQATTTTAKASTTTAGGGTDARSFEQQVIKLTNDARAANGCPPLTHNDKLHAAALAHSTDMATNDYFDHTSLDGSSMSDRIDRQGYQWRRLAENIAYGYRTPSSVVDGWMNSSGHRANILNCNLTEIGVGFYNFYWTQNFGTPA